MSCPPWLGESVHSKITCAGRPTMPNLASVGPAGRLVGGCASVPLFSHYRWARRPDPTCVRARTALPTFTGGPAGRLMRTRPVSVSSCRTPVTGPPTAAPVGMSSLNPYRAQSRRTSEVLLTCRCLQHWGYSFFACFFLFLPRIREQLAGHCQS